MKLGIGIIAAVAVVAVTVVSTSSTLFQGKLVLKQNSTAITRCEFAKDIVTALNLDTKVALQKRPSFSDVPAGSECLPYVEAMKYYGFMNGYANGTFGPSNTMVRAEVAKVLVEAWGLPFYTPATPTFSDVATNSWYSSYVESLYKALGKRACGTEDYCLAGKFNPTATATKEWVEYEISKLGTK